MYINGLKIFNMVDFFQILKDIRTFFPRGRREGGSAERISHCLREQLESSSE